MTQANDPAYPHEEERYHQGNPYKHCNPGMTKREAFAMAAMQGYLASYAGHDVLINPPGIANDSVVMADALIASLNKEK